MQTKPTRVAIGMAISGGIMIVIGIGLFLVTAINVARFVTGSMNTGFSVRGTSGFGSIPGFNAGMPSFVPAVVGAACAAIGGLLVKAGLGVGVVGNAKTIGQAVQSVIRPNDIKIRCQNCNEVNDESAKYCSACGKQM
jgi:hypothetical protein